LHSHGLSAVASPGQDVIEEYLWSFRAAGWLSLFTEQKAFARYSVKRVGLIAYSDGQRIERIADQNGTTNANFVCFGSQDQTKCVYCAKPASFDWSDSKRVCSF